MEPIVITGIGLITPLGRHRDTLFQRLFTGRSAVRPSPFPQAPFFAPVDVELETRYDRSIEMAIACARDALADAGPSFSRDERTAVYISSTKGGMNSLGKTAAPDFLANLMADSASRAAAQELGIKGPCFNVVAACATGIFAISSAMRAMEAGECDRAVVGVAESALTELVLSGFAQMGVLTQKGMRPFRKERDGFAPAEGAAVFTLEKEKAAMERGAALHGRITGCAIKTDEENAVRFDTSGRPIRGAILAALENAKLRPEDIDAVCVHGTATQNNDLCEASGIKSALGGVGAQVECFGVKPSLGHALGASAAVELAVCLLALQSGRLPPTLGQGAMDPACALNISGHGKPVLLRRILSLNFGFGGHIGAIIVEKTENR
jgi:3-oxoacyl-[acyl-carrier-protein] synthase II